jgi:hypothetical protein
MGSIGNSLKSWSRGSSCTDTRMLDPTGATTRSSPSGPRPSGSVDHGPRTLRRPDPGLLVLLCMSTLIGVVFIVVVPAGLPYDEPSHWANTLFYLDHLRLPVLGRPGISYEAQMGPLAYVVGALVAAPLRALGDTSVAFYGVRVVGLLELEALAVVVWLLVRRIAATNRTTAVAAAAVIALNPMLLAMSCSVQNDTLSLLLAAGALLVAVDVTTGAGAVGVGVLVGLALLTKLTVWPVAVVVAARLLYRRSGLAVAYGAAALATAGWWFVRNQHLYGDVTARKGVTAAGFDFPSAGAFQPFNLARSAATYLWVPTEYTRNVLAAPTWIDLTVLAASGVGLIGVVLLVRTMFVERNDVLEPLMLGSVAVLAVLPWAWTASFVQSVAFRVAYVALPFWALGWGRLVTATPRRARALWALIATNVGLSAWFLTSLPDVSGQPFLLRF